jgi:hypothetical protein
MGSPYGFDVSDVANPSTVAGLRMDKAGQKNYLVASLLCHVPAMLIFVFANFYMLLLAFFSFWLGSNPTVKWLSVSSG